MRLKLVRSKCTLVLFSTLALAGVGCGKKVERAAGSTVDPRVQERLDIIATIDPGKAFEYYAIRAGNHPTIYLDRTNERFVVVGRYSSLGERGEAEYFALDQIEAALTAYKTLLVRVGYQPQGAPLPPAENPNALVAVPLDDLLGSDGPDVANFPQDQAEALYNTAPFVAWRVLTGTTHAGNDAPALAGGGSGISVVAPGIDEELSWDQSEPALDLFRQAAARPSRAKVDPATAIEE